MQRDLSIWVTEDFHFQTMTLGPQCKKKKKVLFPSDTSMCVCLLVCNLSSDIPSRVTGNSTNKICQDRHVPTTVQESWHTHTGSAETMLPVFHVSFRLPPSMGAEIWFRHLGDWEVEKKKIKTSLNANRWTQKPHFIFLFLFLSHFSNIAFICLRRGETRPSTNQKRGCKVTYFDNTWTHFQNLPRVPGVFWKSPSESWEGLGLPGLLGLHSPGPSPSKIGVKRVRFLDLPQPGCTESRVGSREVLSERGPSESLES